MKKQIEGMHNIDYSDFEHKVLKIHSVDCIGDHIHAVITTNFLGRVTTKPYSFRLDEWAEVVEKERVER